MPPKLEHSAVTIQHLWPTFGTAAACLFLITCHYWRMKNCWINVSYVYYVVLLWGGVPSELDENQEWSQDWWRDCTMLTNQLATSSTHPRASKSSVSAPKNMNSSSIYCIQELETNTMQVLVLDVLEVVYILAILPELQGHWQLQVCLVLPIHWVSHRAIDDL